MKRNPFLPSSFIGRYCGAKNCQARPGELCGRNVLLTGIIPRSLSASCGQCSDAVCFQVTGIIIIEAQIIETQAEQSRVSRKQCSRECQIYTSLQVSSIGPIVRRCSLSSFNEFSTPAWACHKIPIYSPPAIAVSLQNRLLIAGRCMYAGITGLGTDSLCFTDARRCLRSFL